MLAGSFPVMYVLVGKDPFGFYSGFYSVPWVIPGE